MSKTVSDLVNIHKVKKLAACLVFLTVTAILFNQVSWLFRSQGYSNREALIGFRNEHPLNIVFIGGSNVRCGIQPLEGWREHGITSYNYATDAAKMDLFPQYIDEIRKTNDPELYVIDIRTLPLVVPSIEEMAIRLWSNCYDVFDVTKIRGVASFLFTRNYETEDIPSYFFDIAKYHEQYDMLKNPFQWKLLDKDHVKDISKGTDDVCQINAYEIPEKSPEKTELSELQSRAVLRLLEYCEGKKLNVLFVVSPYIITENDWKIFNSASEMIQERGYPYINFNDYYEETGLDFNYDFSDVNHTNYLGAEKYTRFLFDYISDHYSFRGQGEDSYADWEADYKEYEPLKESRYNAINRLRSELDSTRAAEQELRAETVFDDWYPDAVRSGFSMIVIKRGTLPWNSDDYVFDEFAGAGNLDLLQGNNILVMSGGNKLSDYRNDGMEEGSFGNTRKLMAFQVVDSEEVFGVEIDEIGSFSAGQDELKIIVINNQYRQAADVVSLYMDENGKVMIKR